MSIKLWHDNKGRDTSPNGFGYMESQTIALPAYRAINKGEVGFLIK